MNASTRTWLFEAPLAPVWRKRLELCLAVVITSAIVVALASSIRPDPEKVAALHGVPAVTSVPLQPMFDRTEPDALFASQVMISAASSGDVLAMRKAYRVGMPLDGMLRIAAHSGRKDAVVWLLAHGADVHEQEDTLFSAMLAGDAFPEIVALLRAKGARDPNIANAVNGAAPNAVDRAIATHPERVKHSGVLAGAGRAPWKTAAERRAIITKLLDAGADPDETHAGTSAFGNIVNECDAADDCMLLVKLYLDHGARVSGEVLGAALSLEETRAQVLDALLARPIDKGVTAAALARAKRVTSEDLERIVKLGVDWAWHDGEEDAAIPLLAAVRRGDRDYARALIDAGAPVDVHYKEATSALTIALDSASSDDAWPRIVELLVERGANVNRRLPDGRTPLFAAAEAGNIRVVTFLIEHHARVNERTLNDTPTDAAEQRGNMPAARVLSAHGGVSTHSYNSTY
jgi:ankyrin repeat protein